MKHKHTFLRRVLSIVLSFAVVLPASLALIGDSGSAEAANKATINVLSIESTDDHTLTTTMVHNWTDYADDPNTIKITYMSMLEFVGSIKNLEESYDLIYIGDTPNNSAKNANLDGSFLYANIGKQYAIPSAALGLTDAEYSGTTFNQGGDTYHDLSTSTEYTRYSGDDLTTAKLTELNKYAADGHPVIFAEDLSDGTGHPAAEKITFQADIIGTVSGSSVTLTASATATEGTLPSSSPSYQWYDATNPYYMDPIEGEIYPKYNPTTINNKYYCEISYEVNGVTYTAKSDAYSYELTTTKVTTITNDPDTSQPGSFTAPLSVAIASRYTNNRAYNILNTFTATPSYGALPSGTTLNYKWYRDQYHTSSSTPYASTAYAPTTSTLVNSTFDFNIPDPGDALHYDLYYCIVEVVDSLTNAVITSARTRNYKVTRNSATQVRIVTNGSATNGSYTLTFNPTITPISGTAASTQTLTASTNISSTYTATYTWYRGTSTTPVGLSKTLSVLNSTWAVGTSYKYYCMVTARGSTTSAATQTNTVTLTRSYLATYVNKGGGIPKSIDAYGYVPYTINNIYVDNCSNIYTFLDGVINDRVNVMCSSFVNKTALLNGINLSAPAINLTAYPTVYTNMSGAYLLPGATLSYTFTISNITETDLSTKYNCNLYIDSDANGKYSADEVVVTSDNLVAGTQYVVTYQLPADKVGIIPWKLEVVKVGSEGVSASRSNYTRVAGTAQTINILQINPNYLWWPPNGLCLDTSDPYISDSDISDVRNTIHSYFDEISDDYIINIQTVSIDDINSISPSSTSSSLTNRFVAGATPCDNVAEFLDSYDMVIIGIDNYSKQLNKEACQALASYLESKPILYTHGTSSYTNVPEVYSTYTYGYYVNNYLRDALGIDQYGVTNNTFGHTIMSNPDLSGGISGTVAAGYAGLSSGTTKQDLLDAGYSIAYLPGSNPSGTGGTAVGTTQGFADYYVNENNNLTTQASQVNEGQITSYPFDINPGVFDRAVNTPSIMTISTTNTPFYQLNTNSDDVAVWYCLYKTANIYNDHYEYNNVANAYYLYRSGNATYSGFGHTISSITDAEAKLFVNTIIAASHASSSRSAPTVTFSDSTGLKSLNNYLIPSDSSGVLTTTGATSTDRYLYFKVTDTNGGNKQISASFSYGDEPSTTPIDTPTIYDSSNNIVNTVTTSLVSDAIYHVKIDAVWANLLAKNTNFEQTIANGITLNIKATTSIGGVPMSGTDTLKLRTFTLFNLS